MALGGPAAFVCDIGAHPGTGSWLHLLMGKAVTASRGAVSAGTAVLWPESAPGHVVSENAFWATRVLPHLGKYQSPV